MTGFLQREQGINYDKNNSSNNNTVVIKITGEIPEIPCVHAFKAHNPTLHPSPAIHLKSRRAEAPALTLKLPKALQTLPYENPHKIYLHDSVCVYRIQRRNIFQDIPRNLEVSELLSPYKAARSLLDPGCPTCFRVRTAKQAGPPRKQNPPKK